MKRDGLELILETIEGTGAKVRAAENLLRYLATSTSADIRYITITAPTPAEIDDAEERLVAASLMTRGGEAIEDGEGPLLYAREIRTSRNVDQTDTELLRRIGDEELYLDDLRSSSPEEPNPLEDAGD